MADDASPPSLQTKKFSNQSGGENNVIGFFRLSTHLAIHFHLKIPLKHHKTSSNHLITLKSLKKNNHVKIL